MNAGLIILLVLGAMIVWAIGLYNKLVRQRQLVNEGFSGIDVQLKRRADLIPNLVETVKGYMGHEKAVLEKVTELRTQSQQVPQGDLKARADIEGQISGALSKIMMVAENYPDLKASQNYTELMQNLSSIENDIQLARRYYNGSVRDMNTMVQSFPGNLVAGKFGFKEAQYFELENAADRAVPSVKIQ